MGKESWAQGVPYKKQARELAWWMVKPLLTGRKMCRETHLPGVHPMGARLASLHGTGESRLPWGSTLTEELPAQCGGARIEQHTTSTEQR